MELLQTHLSKRIPHLFADGKLGHKLAIEVPLTLDGNRTASRVGQNVGHGHFFKNGHVLRVFERKLRWASVTVEDGFTKYEFIADFTMDDAKLVLKNFQWNHFLLGVHILGEKVSLEEVQELLLEYMEDDNDWHKGYMVLSDFPDDYFHPNKELIISPEHGTAPMRHLNRPAIQISPGPGGLRALQRDALRPMSRYFSFYGGLLQPLKPVKKGKIINGVIWMNDRPNNQPYPLLLYHKLKIQDPQTLYGLAERVLFASTCTSHEPGFVCLKDTLDEFIYLEDKVVFIESSEEFVLHLFHLMTKDEDESAHYGAPTEDFPKIQMPEFMAQAN